MLTCKQASQFISVALDRPLTSRERFTLILHLFICNKCKQFSQQLQTIRVALKTMIGFIESDNSIEMPTAAKKRITLNIEQQEVEAKSAKP